MGKEALVFAEVGPEAGEVRALVESRELILRGDIRRRYQLADLKDVEARNGKLVFTAPGETVSLSLGDPVAGKWATAMTTPPPDLKTKLGIRGGVRVVFCGPMDDSVLTAALAGSTTEDADQADLLVARVDSAADLDTALRLHAGRPDLPVWVIYPKGKIAFGDTAIRERLRGLGFIDSKSCAVSDRLTATRYGLRKA